MLKSCDPTTAVAINRSNTVDRLTVCSSLVENPQTVTRIRSEQAERDLLAQIHQIAICQHHSESCWPGHQSCFHRQTHQQWHLVAWSVMANQSRIQVAFMGVSVDRWQRIGANDQTVSWSPCYVRDLIFDRNTARRQEKAGWQAIQLPPLSSAKRVILS